MRRLGGLYLYLLLGLFVIGLVLVLLGVDLARLDLWLDSRADLFDAVGSALFRVLCGGILVLSATVVGTSLWQNFLAPTREVAEQDRFGFVAILAATLIGYFAWFGMMG